uniref:Uncharacterized protein n=1 Tax=Pseudo-nitzschia australis TaxID=44445 RepID=A0A7S4AHU1_9STRA
MHIQEVSLVAIDIAQSFAEILQPDDGSMVVMTVATIVLTYCQFQCHFEVFFLAFAHGLAGAVDILPAVERVWVLVAAVGSILAGPSIFLLGLKYEYEFLRDHQPHHIVVHIINIKTSERQFRSSISTCLMDTISLIVIWPLSDSYYLRILQSKEGNSHRRGVSFESKWKNNHCEEQK